MTRDELINTLENEYNLKLMEWQKEALWNFYQHKLRGENYILITPPRTGKAITYEMIRRIYNDIG